MLLERFVGDETAPVQLTILLTEQKNKMNTLLRIFKKKSKISEEKNCIEVHICVVIQINYIGS